MSAYADDEDIYKVLIRANVEENQYTEPKKVEINTNENTSLDKDILSNDGTFDVQPVCEITLKRYNNINDFKIDYINNNDIATIFNKKFTKLIF